MARLDRLGPAPEDLHTFLLFARLGEVSKVAAELGLSDPVVSRRLKVWREEYGLLERDGTPRLCERGKQAIASIEHVLQQYRQLTEWLAGRDGRARVVTLAVGSSKASTLVPHAVLRFRQRCPEWELRVRLMRGRDRVEAVARGTVDLTVVSHDPRQVRDAVRRVGVESDSVSVDPLRESRLCVVVRPDHELAPDFRRLRGRTPTFAELGGWELIGLDADAGVRRQLEASARGEGARLRFGPDAGGWEAVRQYVRLGLGVGVLPERLLTESDRGELLSLRLPEAATVRDHLVYRTDFDDDARATLRAILKELA